MTAYTTITDATLTAGKPGTQAVFRALRDNAIAITEKAAGAPVLANSYVVEAMLAASSVSQGKLKTTDGNVAPPAVPGGHAVLPGGQY